MPRRERVTVWWSKKGYWMSETELRTIPHSRKIDAVAAAVEYCKSQARRGGRLELVIMTKNGRIAKGGHAPRTYPRRSDPRRTKG